MYRTWDRLASLVQGETGEVVSQLTSARPFRDHVYDALAEWYDHWYPDRLNSPELFASLSRLLQSVLGIEPEQLRSLRVLDCAVGTGSTFIAFTRAGIETHGTDGSLEMIRRAYATCESVGVPTDKLVVEATDWTDSQRFVELFGEESFDLILCLGNSFCHLPAADGIMQTALRGFYRLLRPGGRLIIDTKRFRSATIDGRAEFRELQLVNGEWIERGEREETREIANLGLVHFHTRMFYDSDPALGIERAFITLTVYGTSVPEQIIAIPYFPLPADRLEHEMKAAEFSTSVIEAQSPLAPDSKYDLVVGLKELDDGFALCL